LLLENFGGYRAVLVVVEGMATPGINDRARRWC